MMKRKRKPKHICTDNMLKVALRKETPAIPLIGGDADA